MSWNLLFAERAFGVKYTNTQLHRHEYTNTNPQIQKYRINKRFETCCLQREPLMAVVETSLWQGGIVIKDIFR